jgi:hypothetical protein
LCTGRTDLTLNALITRCPLRTGRANWAL